MKKIPKTKSIICSKNELNMICDLFDAWCVHFYELPLFDINQQEKNQWSIETDYVLIRPTKTKPSQSFFNRINKTWNKMYED